MKKNEICGCRGGKGGQEMPGEEKEVDGGFQQSFLARGCSGSYHSHLVPPTELMRTGPRLLKVTGDSLHGRHDMEQQTLQIQGRTNRNPSLSENMRFMSVSRWTDRRRKGLPVGLQPTATIM